MIDQSNIKHLEIIQGVINRMANNSFLLKGWTITLLSGILLFSATSQLKILLLVPIIPTLAFWGIDTYYLRQERLFRKLYENAVNSYNKAKPDLIPFSMDTRPYTQQVATWSKVLVSATEIWFYLPVYIVSIGVNILINLQ